MRTARRRRLTGHPAAAVGALAFLALGGCQTVSPPPTCPPPLDETATMPPDVHAALGNAGPAQPPGIAVSVTSTGGSPLPWVTIQADRDDSGARRAMAFSPEDRVNPEAKMSVAEGRYGVLVWAAGYAVASATVDVVDDDRWTPISIQLLPVDGTEALPSVRPGTCDGILEGTAIFDGAPARTGTTVNWSSGWRFGWLPVVDGRIRYALQAGRYLVGWESERPQAWVTINVGETTMVDLRPDPNARPTPARTPDLPSGYPVPLSTPTAVP